MGTSNGKGDFHLMGTIECTISQGEFQDKSIKRMKHLLKSRKLTKQARNKISWYNFPSCGVLSKVILKPISFITKELPRLSMPKSDYLWQAAVIFRKLKGKD